MGQTLKAKYTFEFQNEDWCDMINMLPDILEELDHEIAENKARNTQLAQVNEEMKKKIDSVDNQVYTV